MSDNQNQTKKQPTRRTSVQKTLSLDAVTVERLAELADYHRLKESQVVREFITEGWRAMQREKAELANMSAKND